MAVTYVTASGATWGVVSAETYINAATVTKNFKPEFKEPLKNRDNTNRDWAVAPTMGEFTVKGERLSSTYPFAANFYTAATLAATHAAYGCSGTVLLDEVTETEDRGNWIDIEGKMSCHSGIVLT